jgi:hypothetical protein
MAKKSPLFRFEMMRLRRFRPAFRRRSRSGCIPKCGGTPGRIIWKVIDAQAKEAIPDHVISECRAFLFVNFS